jgi:hypothetical protein
MFQMLLLHEPIFDQAETDAAIAEARAQFDRDPAALDAVALSTFELWARPDQLARANGQPATATRAAGYAGSAGTHAQS